MKKWILRTAFYNWAWLLGFEILHKLFGFLLLIPAFQRLLANSFDLSNFYLIDRETILLIWQRPTALLVCLLWAFAFALYCYCEWVAVLLCCTAARQDARPAPLRMLLLALRRTGALLLPRNLPLLGGLMLVLPCGVFWLGLFCWVGIPLALPGIVLSIRWLCVLCFVCTASGLLCGGRILFGLPAMALDGIDCIAAWRQSGQILRTRGQECLRLLLQTAICFFAGLLMLFLAAVLVTLLSVGILGGGDSLFQIVYLFWSTPAATLSLVCGLILLASTTLCLVRPEPPAEICTSSRTGRLPRALWLLGCFCLLFATTSELLYPLPENGTRVVAHRAGALFAPENSRTALRLSTRNGANEAEIDVQQTRDGVPILLHDYNLRRTVGVDWDIWDTDYADIRALKLSEPVITLEEAIAEFPDLHLMIELKRTGRERFDLAAQTVSLIHQYNARERCSIGSMDLSLLERVKALDPSIDTVYITSLLYADQYGLDYINAYSLEVSLLTPEMTEQLRQDGKRVYVWTVNSGRAIRRAIYCAPDGIITDNTYLTQYYLKHGQQNHLLVWLTDLCYSPVNNLPIG